MNAGRFAELSLWLFAGMLGAAAVSYATYAIRSWYRYGRISPPCPAEADSLMDCFMSDYEVVERRNIRVKAAAEVTYAAACQIDLQQSRGIRAIFKARELILRSKPNGVTLP